MHGTKIIEFFERIAREDLRWFADFLHSPYFNKNESVRQLGDTLIQLRRSGFNEKNMRREAVYATTWPGKQFDAKDFNHHCSYLLQLGQRFLAQRSFEAQEEKSGYYQLLACDEAGLEKSWPQQRRKSRRLLARQQLQSPESLWRIFQIDDLEQRRFARSGQRSINPHLQEAADALDRYYFAEKLKLSCTMLNANLALGSQLEIRLLAGEHFKALAHLPKGQLARLYGMAYQLLRTSNQVDLLRTYNLAVKRAAKTLASAERNELINHAVNYCVRQIRDGHRDFVEELLRIYQDNLKAGHLFVDGLLSPWNYKNMVKLGLGLRRFEWVADLVENYALKLPQADRSDAYHFTMADLKYHQQDFDAALDFLNQTEFSDIHYALGAKVMLIKIYYETEAVEALLSLLFSFKIYLKRNRKIGAATRDAYFNFIRFVEQLQAGRDPEKIKARIQKTNALTDRNWLLARL